jgi:hypothetical protein
MSWLTVLLIACQQAPPAVPPRTTRSEAGAPATAPPAAIPWQWDRAPDLSPWVDVTAGEYVLSLDKKNDRLMLRGPSWSVQVAARPYQVSRAALAADGGRVFVAFHNGGTPGCDLAAFDGASGKPLWSIGLEGIGPMISSAYLNRVQMRIIGGHPTVFGSEHRRYIEQRDAATGALVSHQLFPGARQPVPISEYLFYELNQKLRKRAAYKLRVNKFVVGNNLMKAADHAALGAALTEAVAQLSQVRRFELELIDTGDDFELIAKRLPSRTRLSAP